MYIDPKLHKPSHKKTHLNTYVIMIIIMIIKKIIIYCAAQKFILTRLQRYNKQFYMGHKNPATHIYLNFMSVTLTSRLSYRIEPKINKLLVLSTKHKKNKKRRRLPINLNRTWRKFKYALKYVFKRGPKPPCYSFKYNLFCRFAIFLKRKTQNYTVYRKKYHSSLIYVKNNWLANKSKFKQPSNNAINPLLTKKVEINFFLLYFYKVKRNKKKKPKKLLKQPIFESYKYKPIKLTIKSEFAEKTNYKFIFYKTNPIATSKQTQLSLIKTKTQQTLFHFTTRVNPNCSNLYKRNIHNTGPLNNKKTILTRLFSFYENNLAVNNLIVHSIINNTELLKIKKTLGPKSTSALLNYTRSTTNKPPTYYNALNLLQFKLPNSLNNFYPLMEFLGYSSKYNYTYNNLIFRLYYSKIGIVTSSKYKTFYTFFLISFLENFLKKKIWIRADSRDFFSLYRNNQIRSKLLTHSFTYSRFRRLISTIELTDIILIMFITRDLQIFLLYLKKCFEKAHFKKHKKILSIIFDTFRKNRMFMDNTGIKGFFFDIRGKVGVSGNAKKRHVSFSLGKTTTTSQNIKSYFQQINVWTPTGQMGITCYILF